MPLALRVLWTALANDTTRIPLVERQLERLENLVPALTKATESIAHETDRMLSLSCSIQLAWHLAATKLAASTDAPQITRRGRGFQDAQLLREEQAAGAIQAARTVLSNALALAAKLTPDEAVLAPMTMRGNVNVEASPGEARPKARARTSEEGDRTESVSGKAAESGGCDMRALLVAWAAEGCAIGLFDEALAESAVNFTTSSLRHARSASGCDPSSLDQLLPHASKLTLQVF